MTRSTIIDGQEVVTPAGWPVPEERRTVTVLFADIVGSTALVDRLDPEDVRALQRAYFDTVAGVLRRWGGVVEKYIGDAVMALFGARNSDGFDAYRAVRAGLEIQRTLDQGPLPGGTTVRVRVGVATGEALVDVAALRDGGHGSASGAVITMAARLQEYAPPGAVALCAATHRATAGLISQRALAPATVAGKPRPVEVWHATDAIRPRTAPHHGPLVGRRRELATAQEQIVRAVREHRPRWVSLVGPAGSGRGRLLHELTRTVRTIDGRPVRWLVTHCPPYPDGVLAPVADLVRAFAGVRDGDSAPAVRHRLTTALRGLVRPAGLPAAVQALDGLLAGPDRSVAAGRGVAVWQRVLLAVAARQPVVVAVDDVDRAAPELSRFLHTLFAAATARGLPVAVVTTHRPQWADLVPGPGGRGCRVALTRLGAVDTGRLLRQLLVRAGRPVTLVNRLLPLVDGNPGRAEAYVRLRDEGLADPTAELPVPEAVRRAVGARLDLLDGDQRAVLMAGAALAGEVTAATVERLLCWTPGRAAPVLRQLAGGGLLVRRPSPDGYGFADPVLRRVAGERLPRAARAEFARRADTEDAADALHVGRAGFPRAGTEDAADALHARRAGFPRRADTEDAAGALHVGRAGFLRAGTEDAADAVRTGRSGDTGRAAFRRSTSRPHLATHRSAALLPAAPPSTGPVSTGPVSTGPSAPAGRPPAATRSLGGPGDGPAEEKPCRDGGRGADDGARSSTSRDSNAAAPTAVATGPAPPTPDSAGPGPGDAGGIPPGAPRWGPGTSTPSGSGQDGRAPSHRTLADRRQPRRRRTSELPGTPSARPPHRSAGAPLRLADAA